MHPRSSACSRIHNKQQGRVRRLSVDDRMALVRSFAQEIVQEDELQRLFANKASPTAYDGFEPSGRMHIAQGVMKALNVNKLAKCGVRFKFWCATLLRVVAGSIAVLGAVLPSTPLWCPTRCRFVALHGLGHTCGAGPGKALRCCPVCRSVVPCAGSRTGSRSSIKRWAAT